MADFTDQDKELLDKLRKGFERDAKTRSQLEPWNELLSRDETTNANRAVAAAKILEGFAGSWASQYKYGYGSTINPTGSLVGEEIAGYDPQGPPVPIHAKANKLGLRGVPEINFVPYNWRTNSFGSKGPSLVGHPIGFEVVGPTLKSQYMDWTWRVELGTGTGGGDVLVMDVRPDGTPNVMQPYAGNISNAYGPRILNGSPFWTIGGAGEPNGGLYVVISDPGENPGSVPPGRLPMPPLDLYTDAARFEIFRVAAIPILDAGLPYEIHLHPDKRLSTIFDVSNDPDLSIRGIMLLQPYVTRLQAIPQSGAAGGNDGMSSSGREQTFVVLSPERAAAGDNFPPYNGGTPADGTWIQGGFTSSRGAFSTVIGGEPSAYGGRNRLPIPNPVREVAGNVDSQFAVPSTLVGQWAIETGTTVPYTTGLFASRFPIVRISNTQRDDDLPSLAIGTVLNCLGWFDAVGTLAAPDRVLMNRVPETDPYTGLTYWGPGPFQLNNLASREVGVLGTLHEPIEALWYDEFNLDNVESSRLRNLIDPQWVGRYEKQISDTLLVGGQPAPPAGSGPGRPDRAIFSTRSFAGAGPIPNAENPGSLLDLGFRMVLFPAKANPNDATQTIPDFNRPITGRELVIDGSIAEKQYIDVDYSAGVVRLSHPPPESRGSVPLAPTDIIPNGITGLNGNNPRGEVVLFAACVPYSMEDSQLGTGNRVTGSAGAGQRDFDLYSGQITAFIDLNNTTFSGTSPYIGPSVPTASDDIILDRLLPDCPETGVITITHGSDNSRPFGRFGYSRKTTVTVGILQVTALGGITAAPAATDPDPGVTNEIRMIAIRREAVFGSESFSLPALQDTYVSDTYYGSSARADTLRFERARLYPELDGSLSVRPLPDLAANLDRVTGSIVPSRRSLPHETALNAGPYTRSYFAEEGIYDGLLYQIDPSSAGALGGSINAGGRYLPSFQFLGDQDRSPTMEFSTPGGVLPLYQGIITSGLPGTVGNGMFTMEANVRFVAKVAAFARNPNTDTNAFVGFIQDETGPGLDPVIPTLSDPTLAPPLHFYIGFQFDTTAAPVWRFWTRGPSGDNLIGTTAVVDPTAVTLQGPYYLVIEMNRLPNAGSDFSRVVKMGVYDGAKNLLSSTRVTDTGFLPSVAGRGFFTAVAMRETVVPAGGMDLYLYFAKIVLDTDIEDLPPLP